MERLTRGTLISSPLEHQEAYYLILTPGEESSLVADLFTRDPKVMLEGMLLGTEFEKSFIGTFHSKTLYQNFSFLPMFRPIPNVCLQSSDNKIIGVLNSDDMRSFSQSLRLAIGGYLYRKSGRPNGWWTPDRKEEFLEDWKTMSAGEIAQKWEIETNSAYKLRSKFFNEQQDLLSRQHL